MNSKVKIVTDYNNWNKNKPLWYVEVLVHKKDTGYCLAGKLVNCKPFDYNERYPDAEITLYTDKEFFGPKKLYDMSAYGTNKFWLNDNT